MMNKADFAKHMASFIRIYLPSQNFSENTVCSYGDTFLLLMNFAEEKYGIQREKLSLSDISYEFVLAFIQWLQDTRNCSPSTCNNRLAAIKSFVRYAITKEVAYLYEAQRILNIKAKRTQKPNIQHLTKDQIKSLIESPDKNTPQGRRDITLLCLMYDSGARVQEICDLSVMDVRVQAPPVVTLRGKGMKTRTVPILAGTAKLLQSYINENKLNTPDKTNYPLFMNHQHEKLTRAGITYILKKYFQIVHKNDATMPEKISPHILRHSKAMHMLQANIHLIYIRDFLGHESVQTTEVYAKANPETKRKAIEKVQLQIETDLPDWRLNKKLMNMLESFGSITE